MTALQVSSFSDPEYKEDITQEIESLLSSNTRQVDGFVEMTLYRVNYRYETGRGNQKADMRLLFLPVNARERAVKRAFYRSIKRFNKDNPYRKIKVLEVTCIEPYANADLHLA